MEIPRQMPTGLSESDQTASLKKIMAIEDKLLAKQEETKAKSIFSVIFLESYKLFLVESLQTSVEKFKKELEAEKEKNSNLLRRYTSQTKTVENMKIEINLCKHEHLHDKKQIDNLKYVFNNKKP